MRRVIKFIIGLHKGGCVPPLLRPRFLILPPLTRFFPAEIRLGHVRNAKRIVFPPNHWKAHEWADVLRWSVHGECIFLCKTHWIAWDCCDLLISVAWGPRFQHVRLCCRVRFTTNNPQSRPRIQHSDLFYIPIVHRQLLTNDKYKLFQGTLSFENTAIFLLFHTFQMWRILQYWKSEPCCFCSTFGLFGRHFTGGVRILCEWNAKRYRISMIIGSLKIFLFRSEGRRGISWLIQFI